MARRDGRRSGEEREAPLLQEQEVARGGESAAPAESSRGTSGERYGARLTGELWAAYGAGGRRES
jgi:hypothetical protein